VYPAPDDPVAIDEAQALALVILGPAMPHSGKGAVKSLASEAATDALMRCRAAGDACHRSSEDWTRALLHRSPAR
jgi:hypothetical protein